MKNHKAQKSYICLHIYIYFHIYIWNQENQCSCTKEDNTDTGQRNNVLVLKYSANDAHRFKLHLAAVFDLEYVILSDFMDLSAITLWWLFSSRFAFFTGTLFLLPMFLYAMASHTSTDLGYHCESPSVSSKKMAYLPTNLWH